MNSKDKGKRGERQVAELLRQYGYKARRGQQFNGIDGKDVVGFTGHHVEVKYTEAFRLYQALEQATADGSMGEIPIVFYRKNGKPWVVVMLAEDYLGEVLNGQR